MASALLTSDPYKRPWTMGAGVQTTLPLPFTRTFGVGYEPNLTRTIAGHAVEVQSLGVKAVINEPLRQVESDYWALVNAAAQVGISDRMKKAALELDIHMANLYERGQITESDRAQVEAQVAGIASAYDTAVQGYFTTANRLRETLDIKEPVSLRPVGFTVLLAQPEERVEDVSRVRDNPAYRQAVVRVMTMAATLEARDRQTNPDIRANAAVQFSQNGALFGYRHFEDSLTNLFNPDSVTTTLGIGYVTTLGERAVHAARAQAEAGEQQQALLRDATELALDNELRDAGTAVRSARARVEITRRGKESAQMVFDRAKQYQDERRVTEYELTEKLIKLLETEKAHVQAMVAAKQAKARLLGAAGALIDRFGEQTAETEMDRQRISGLKTLGLVDQFAAKEARP